MRPRFLGCVSVSTSRKLIYGFHAVLARLRQQPDSVHEVYLDRQRHDARAADVSRLIDEHDIAVHAVEGQRLDRLAGHGRHQGVLAFVEERALSHSLDDILDAVTDEPPLVLILDGIQDPHNLGACLRVANAMGAHAVVAPKDRAVGLTATAMKVASGAAETTPYIQVTNLVRTLKELQERDIWVVGTAAEGAGDLFEFKHRGGIALVMGAEGDGMRRLTRETCDELIRIPMFGTVESLNVSVATGICLAHMRRLRGGSAS